MATKNNRNEFKDLKMEEIINYCQEHDKVEWLKEVCAERPTYMVIKQRFLTEVIGLAPAKKEKKPTIYDIVAAL